MSAHVSAWVWELGELKPADRLLLLAIADNANDDGWLRWPQPHLARRCSMTEATLRSHVKVLVAAELLYVDGAWARAMVPWESGS